MNHLCVRKLQMKKQKLEEGEEEPLRDFIIFALKASRRMPHIAECSIPLWGHRNADNPLPQWA